MRDVRRPPAQGDVRFRPAVIPLAAPLTLLALLCACSTAADQPDAQAGAPTTRSAPDTADAGVAAAEIAAPVLTVIASARDTTATLAELQAFTSRIDRDTSRMRVRAAVVDAGAGATDSVTAWRVGGIVQRLRVTTTGATFRSSDVYWLADGALVGARLETTRSGNKPRLDTIWFHNTKLYRWIDADRRSLNAESRSTEYEVEGLRARLDRLLAAVADTAG